jgi:magnesium transporter
MARDMVFVHTDTDQEEVARIIQRYDFLAVPVVDSEQRLVGVITVDDVIDILEQETTEDIYALGGVQSQGDNYFQTNLLTVARRRVVWLFVLPEQLLIPKKNSCKKWWSWQLLSRC